MLLINNFYAYIFLILTYYGTQSECSEGLFSSVSELFFGKKEDRVPNANIIADYEKVITEREDEIQKLNSILDKIDVKVTKLKQQATKCFPQTNGCLPFGNSSGIHQTYAPGFDEPFDVLCNSKLAGPGWLVIQQRIGGKENFERNFSDYSRGFGSLDSDFFLGLEKIHRLTSAYRHELYVYFEAKDYNVTERYDWFRVGSKNEQYRLHSLGKNLQRFFADRLRKHENMDFYTFDRDNKYKCAKNYNSGWWFNDCGRCNLNGNCDDIVLGCHCEEAYDIKNIKMLIRPKMD